VEVVGDMEITLGAEFQAVWRL